MLQAQPNLNADQTMSIGGAISGQNPGWPYHGVYNLVPNGNLNGFNFNQSNPTCYASYSYTFGSPYSGWYTSSPNVFQPSGWNYQGGVAFGHSAAWRCDVNDPASTVNQSHAVIHNDIYDGALILRTHFSPTGAQPMREYMYVRLARPLMHGKVYSLRFTVAAVNNSTQISSANVWHDQIGVVLSSSPPNWQGAYFNAPVTNQVPAASTPIGQVVSDTAITIIQEIVGNGEEWLMVGCFAPDDSLSFSTNPDSQHEARYLFDQFAIWDNNCNTPNFLTLPQVAATPVCPPFQQNIYTTSGFDNYHWYLNGVLQNSSGYQFSYASNQTHNLSIAGSVGGCYDSLSLNYPVQFIDHHIPNDTFLFCGDPLPILLSPESNMSVQWTQWTDLSTAEVQFGTLADTLSHYGDYAIETMTSTGCLFYDTLHVWPRLLPDVNALNEPVPLETLHPASCPGISDGFISLVYPGIDSLHYMWSVPTLDTNAAGIYNLPSGPYQLRVYNSNLQCDVFSWNLGFTTDSCARISGRIVHDTLPDCIADAAEPGIANVWVQSIETGRQALTDSLGHYELRVPPGAQTIHQLSFPSAFMGTVCPNAISLNVPALNAIIPNINFTDTLQAEVQSPNVLMPYHGSAVPGGQGIMGFSVRNDGNTASPVKIQLDLNDTLMVLSASAYVSGSWNVFAPTLQNGTIFTWEGVLQAMETVVVRLNYEVPADPFLTGSVLHSHGWVIPMGSDIDEGDNHVTITQIVVNSFDPNIKSVQPSGEGPLGLISAQDAQFSYRVEFQNTGTAPAQNIVVEDTISALFDSHTFEFMGSSHPCTVEWRSGNVLRVNFLSIQLPDSSSNEPQSHGWFHYRILKYPTVQAPGTEFRNTAYIYFDFNPPVITNTTINTIRNDATVALNGENTSQLGAYPNPCQNRVWIHAAVGPYAIRDISGRLVQQGILPPSGPLGLEGLQNGIYLLTVSDTSGRQQTLRLVHQSTSIR